jgi:hypothetical protein
MNCFQLSRGVRHASVFAAALLAGAAALSESSTANAQTIYVYAPPPPPPQPPPPPPPPGYYYAPRAQPVAFEEPFALVIAADLEGAVPVNMPQLDGNALQGGGGFKVRVGEQIRLARGLRLIAEGGYAFDHLFASDDIGDSYSWDMHRVFGGARLSFGRFLAPVLYAHLGYGWRLTGDPSVPQTGGLALDVGAGLDLRFWRHLVLGVHVEYATIDAQPYIPEWVALGGHLEVVL